MIRPYLMNKTSRKPTTGRQSPSLFDKWHRIFYMPSRIYRRGWTYQGLWLPMQSRSTSWGKAEMFSSAGGTRTDNTSVRSRMWYQLSHPGSQPIISQILQKKLPQKNQTSNSWPLKSQTFHILELNAKRSDSYSIPAWSEKFTIWIDKRSVFFIFTTTINSQTFPDSWSLTSPP